MCGDMQEGGAQVIGRLGLMWWYKEGLSTDVHVLVEIPKWD